MQYHKPINLYFLTSIPMRRKESLMNKCCQNNKVLVFNATACLGLKFRLILKLVLT